MMTKEENQKGGQNQARKVYYCHRCGGIGRGNSMVSNHLKKQCTGKQGRKLKKATLELSDRLDEALHNTKVWRTEQINREVAQHMRDNEESVRAHIEELHRVIQSGAHDVMQHYYSKIF